MKKNIILSLKILISFILFWILIRQSQLNFNLLYTLIKAPLASILILIICYLMVIVHAWRWYRLNFIQNILLKYSHTLWVTYVGVAFNTVLPGSIGGDFVRLYHVCKQFPGKKTKATLSIFFDRVSGLMGIFTIGCALIIYYLEILNTQQQLNDLLMMCAICCVLGGLIFLVTPFLFAENFILARKLKSLSAKYHWLTPINHLLESISVFKNAKLIMLESLCVSIFTQILLLITVMMIGHVMSLPPLSAPDYMLALVIAQIANLLPLTPGGIGVGEAAFVNVIHTLHPELQGAYATVFFGVRMMSTIAYLPGVIIALFRKSENSELIKRQSLGVE